MGFVGVLRSAQTPRVGLPLHNAGFSQHDPSPIADMDTRNLDRQSAGGCPGLQALKKQLIKITGTWLYQISPTIRNLIL
jgi:hypothetical protein